MIRKKLAVVWILVAIFSLTAKADAPPGVGYTKISVNLIFESSEDFSDYRFFIDSLMGIEEISVKKGETVNIDTTGRAGAGSIVMLLAIPKNNLTEFGQLRSAEQLKKLHESLSEKQINGVIELLVHSFLQEIPIYKKALWTNPLFRLESDPVKKIKAVQIGGSAESGQNSEAFSTIWLIAICLAVFISLSILVIGGWFIRKTFRKN